MMKRDAFVDDVVVINAIATLMTVKLKYASNDGSK